MNSKKTTNRENARRSSGPTTLKGKRASSRNALKSGFFARELYLSDTDKAEVEALRRSLCAQLLPTTPLQSIALEEIVCCTWRVKLATQHERSQLIARLDIPKDQAVEPERPTGPAPINGWYGAGRQELNNALRFLEDVMQDFESNGRIREESKEGLVKAFGAEFYDLLIKWTPMSFDAILMCNHMSDMGKDYGLKPCLRQSDESPQLTLDPDQGRQMVGKLLELTLQHLRDLHHSIDQRISGSALAQNSCNSDFAPRYFTSATRATCTAPLTGMNI